MVAFVRSNRPINRIKRKENFPDEEEEEEEEEEDRYRDWITVTGEGNLSPEY